MIATFPKQRLCSLCDEACRIRHHVTVHFIDNDTEERRGPGMLVAIDRHRFNRCIRQMESILTPEEHKISIHMRS